MKSTKFAVIGLAFLANIAAGAPGCPVPQKSSVTITVTSESYTKSSAPTPATVPSSTTSTTHAGYPTAVRTTTASTTTSTTITLPSTFVKASGSSTSSNLSKSPASSSHSVQSSVPSSQPTSPVLSGDATFYGGNVAGGACSFSTYTIPSGLYGTALSDSNWDNAGNCGACVQVKGPSGSTITAMIVDECPGCGSNHLDLFPDAFAVLADPSKGIIPVDWTIVDCPITSPIQLHNKSGVSAYWFSMQVVNANEAVASLEVSIDNGKTWKTTTRQTYNFFEISSGTGTSSVTVKVTSTSGKTIVVDNVPISSDKSVTGTSNF